MTEWIEQLLADPKMLRMGHCQRLEDLNLGMGWIYYALTRLLRPKRAVVIGSYRGFVPLILGKALADNVEGGSVWFIDPSLVDDFWTDPAKVDRHFASFGVKNIRHFRGTTQEFVESEHYRVLGEVGLVHVDGFHTEDQVRFDYYAFESRLAPGGIMLFHDSVVVRRSKVYDESLSHEFGVRRFIDSLREDRSLQIFDLPVGPGLTLVRKVATA